jgi:hypothetical protein
MFGWCRDTVAKPKIQTSKAVSSHRTPKFAALGLWLLCAATGCGSRLSAVHGTVTLEDGKPLTRGMVILEGGEAGAAVMARGEIKPDGSYQLSTYKPGDGVPPGKYRVHINPMDLSEVPDERKNLPFDAKYLKVETSGLEYDVKAGSNDIPITLARPARRR